MPRAILAYIRVVDRLNRGIGRLAMYLLFALMGVLLWSSVSKTFFNPALWTLETAQFVMVAYYVLGGPYSMQIGAHVRMDLFYGDWSLRRKAAVDVVTMLFLLVYLGVLLYGGISSAAYALGYFGTEPLVFFRDLALALVTGGAEAASGLLGHMERSSSVWRPVLWPVKAVMILGVTLMLLQCLAELFKDIARLRGEEVGDVL